MARVNSHHRLPGLLLAVLLSGAAIGARLSAETPHPVPAARVLDFDTPIYSDHDPLSATLTQASPGQTYLVRSQFDGWYGIELPDGGVGWVVTRHVAVRPGGALPGTGGEIAAALAGTAVGGTATLLLLAGTFSLADPFGGLFERVHGSKAVSGNAITLGFSACATCALLTPAAAAFGAYSVGERHQPGGSMLRSWISALAGTTLGSGLGYFIDALSSGATQGLFSGIGFLAGTTAGAVVGYESSKPQCARQYRWTQRLRPPAVGLVMDGALPKNQSLALRVSVIDLRF